MKTYLLTILAAFAIIQGVYSQGTRTPSFKILILLNSNGKDSTGVITITSKGKTVQTLESKGQAIPVYLDLNSYYLVKCTMPGYITKTVYVNTKVPDGRELTEFVKFTCKVDLFKEDGKTKASDKPVGGVKYNPEMKDFDVDKSYK